MHGPELFRLGRRLMKLGVRALPASSFRDLPASVRMVLVDVFEHPGSAIGHIAERTGFPQSHVSAAVARLRDLDMVVTTSDPADRRRTLVSPSPDHLTRLRDARSELEPVDDLVVAALVEHLGPDGAALAPDALAALEVLARVFLTDPSASPAPCDPPTPCDRPTSRPVADSSDHRSLSC